MSTTVPTTTDRPDEEQARSPEQAKAQEIATGLADAGAFLAANPELAGVLGGHLYLYVGQSYRSGDARARIEAWITAARLAGARITEITLKDSGGVDIWFGPVCWHVYASSEELGGARPETKRVRRRAHRPLLGVNATGGAQ